MKYNIIYVDPPWGFKNKKTGGSAINATNLIVADKSLNNERY